MRFISKSDQDLYTRPAVTQSSQRQELIFYRQSLWQNSLICYLDAAGCIQQINPRFEQLLGLPESELIGHSYTILLSILALPAETIDLVLATMRNSLEQESMWRGELCFYTGSYTLAWADVTLMPIKNEANQIMRHIIVGHEVTHQKNHQHQIHVIEQALEDAYTVANLGSWTYQLQTHRIIWSEQVFKIYGLIPDSVPSADGSKGFVAPSPQEVLACFHPDDRPLYERAVTAAIQKGESFDLDLRILTFDGHLKYVQLVGRPLFAHQRYVTHVHGTIMEITARKEAQLQLVEQNEQLLKINQQLDRFVYSAAHDLRAPLMSLLGLIELLEDNASASEKEFYLNLMKQSIARMDVCISDIVDFSRNSRTPLHITEIDLRALCQQLWEQLSFASLGNRSAKRLKNTVEQTGRAIDFQINLKAQLPFCSDQKRVSTLLSNFLSNAIRYSDSTKASSFIHIDVDIQADHATIAVRDNGIGIAQEHIEKIFDMFYRATDSKTGSGLGLFIVKEIISTLNGRIHVESTLGEGTVFAITLPNTPLMTGVSEAKN